MAVTDKKYFKVGNGIDPFQVLEEYGGKSNNEIEFATDEESTAGVNTTKAMSPARVLTAIQSLAIGTLGTLSNVAIAATDSVKVALQKLQAQVNFRAPLASPALTGTPTAPTAAVATNTTQIATTAFVKNQNYAPLASPGLTGTPTAPTAAVGTNNTQIATTAFVKNSITVPENLSFIYKCTGIDDDVAISNIVKDFYENGTAMAMKLTISGNIGFHITNNNHIEIIANNVRGAYCTLDFSDCNVPDYIPGSGIYMFIQTSNLKIVGLNIKGIVEDGVSMLFTVIIHNSNNISFYDCHIGSDVMVYGEGTAFAVRITGINTDIYFYHCTLFGRGDEMGNGYGITIPYGTSGRIIVDSCNIYGTTSGIEVETDNINAEIKIINCVINQITQRSVANTIKWYIVGNSFVGSRIFIDRAPDGLDHKISETLYMPQYANSFNCTMRIDGVTYSNG